MAGKKEQGLAPAGRKATDPVSALIPTLELCKPQIAAALPRGLGLDAARFVRLVVTVLRGKPELTRDLPSLFGSVMLAAQVGMELDPTLGHAFLVPYKGKCTLQIGYRGYYFAGRKSGMLREIHADYVSAVDLLEYSYGTGRELRHKPGANRLADDGKGGLVHPLVGAYCYTELVGGGVEFVVLDESEVMRRRNSSASWKSGGDSAWKTHPWTMWRKSAVRAWGPQGPLSVQRMALIEDLQDRGIVGQVSRELTEGSAAALAAAPLEVEFSPVEPEAVGNPATAKLDEFAARQAPPPEVDTWQPQEPPADLFGEREREPGED